jgi:hypothetical protein
MPPGMLAPPMRVICLLKVRRIGSAIWAGGCCHKIVILEPVTIDYLNAPWTGECDEAAMLELSQ